MNIWTGAWTRAKPAISSYRPSPSASSKSGLREAATPDRREGTPLPFLPQSP